MEESPAKLPAPTSLLQGKLFDLRMVWPFFALVAQTCKAAYV
jgi:hypothetical protein